MSSVVISGILFRNYLVSGALGQPWPGANIFWATLLSSFQNATSIQLGGRELWGPWLIWLVVPAQLLAAGFLVILAARKILANSTLHLRSPNASHGYSQTP